MSALKVYFAKILKFSGTALPLPMLGLLVFGIASMPARTFADKAEDADTGTFYRSGQPGDLRKTAERADDYVNSLGIVYTGGDPKLVADLGVRFVRGDVRREGTEIYRNLFNMTNGRIKTVALVHPIQQYKCENNPSRKANRILPQDQWATFMDKEILADGTEWIAAFESLNEYPGQSTRCAEPSNDPAVRTAFNPDYADQLRDFQKFLYNYIKNVRGLSQPVLGPSMWARSRPMFEESTKKLGNIDAWTDYATFHYYSYNSFVENRMGWYRPTLLNNMYGGVGRNKPSFMTETGTCLTGADAEEIKAKFLTRSQAFFFSFNPKNKTFQFVFSADTDDGCWNLVDQVSGRPLPAWYAMRNVISILDDDDKEGAFTPGTLDYSLSGDTSDIKTLLLQKKDGTYYLLIWKAVRPTDARVPLTLNLPAASSVSIYEPANLANIANGSQPLRTVADTKSVPIQVPDHVMIVAIGEAGKPGAPHAQAVAPVAAAPAAPVAAVPAGTLRIDAGAAAGVTTGGQTWAVDQGFVGGQTANRPRMAIAGTTDEVLYQTVRYGLSGYRLTLPNGTYTVRLHFAETFPGVKRGQRVFDVAVNGRTLSSIDVIREAGGRKRALVKTVDGVVVKDGTLAIDFSNTGGGEPPIINAIEVLPK